MVSLFREKDCHDAFKEKFIKEGISYVSNLFPDDFELIFLANRWFNSTGLMKHEDHKVWKILQNLPRYKYRTIKYEKIQITDSKYTNNIIISDSIDTNEPWVPVYAKNLNRSIKDYSIVLVVLNAFLKFRNLIDFI